MDPRAEIIDYPLGFGEKLAWNMIRFLIWAETQEGLGDGPPKEFEVGDGPCIRPPNILRSSVV